MRSSTPLVFGLCAAILAGCGGPTTVAYTLTFDTRDPGVTEQLSKAAIRVMERRLDRLGADMTKQEIVKEGDEVHVTIGVSDSASAKALTDELTSPFDLQIMAQVDSASGADVTVEGFGSFAKTGVTGDDLEYVVSSLDPATKGGVVRIPFTEEGLAKMRRVFQDNVGKNLGLFVRGKLVSALEVKDAELPNPLVIDGVPDAELASIFADDVNVGTHVTVSPL
jgi:preprotein translocase subunit SecD